MRRFHVLAILWLLVFAVPALFSAETTLQPRAAVVINDASDDPYYSMLQAQLEYSLTTPQRYRLARIVDDRDPDEIVGEIDADAVLFVRLVPRRDGSLRVEADVWNGDSFSWSGEYELEDSEQRFATAAVATREMATALDGAFAPFGIVEFENRGIDTPFEVFIDGMSFGHSLQPLGLPPGTYRVEIRRRDEIFEYTVAAYDLDVAPDDYVRLVFELERRLPPVPGLVRLAAVNDPWRFGLDFTGGAMTGLGRTEYVSDLLITSFVSVSTKGWLFDQNVWGIETGYAHSIYWSGEDDDEGTIQVSNVPLIAYTGFQLGPAGPVDFLFRVGGGLNLSYLDWEIYDEVSDTTRRIGAESIAPAIRGVFEFGVRLGKRARIGLRVHELTIIEADGAYSWIGFGTSFGVRM